MVLAELAAWLQADGIGTVGTDIFYGILPDTPDAVICLHEYPGFPNDLVLGSNTINAEWPHVQVVVRGVKDDYDNPRLKIAQVVNSFTKIGETVLSGVRYHAVMAKQAPFMVQPDGNWRNLFKVNFAVYKDPSV